MTGSCEETGRTSVKGKKRKRQLGGLNGVGVYVCHQEQSPGTLRTFEA